MSRRSQDKRATRAKERAKQRAHQRQREQQAGQPRDEEARDARARFEEVFGWYRESVPSAPGARELMEQVRDGRVLAPVAASEARAMTAEAFYADAEGVLVAWVRDLYAGGWQPTELIRIMRLRAKGPGGELMRLAVAAERAARQGPTLRDPLWVRQWDAARLPRHLPAAGWAAAWADRIAGGDGLEEFFRLVLMAGGLPRLELLLPPLSGARPPLAARSFSATTNPVLERVRALLAKAESTDHEAEAMVYTAKAQELMTKHAIEQAMLDAADPAASAPGLIRIPIDSPYADAKAHLLQTVAEHTRCRAVYLSAVAMSSVVGYPADLEAVELLFTSLLVQAQRGMADASASASPGARARSQGYRAAFLSGFTRRIGERLGEVRRAAYAGAGGEAFLPVLRSRDARVEAFLAEHFRPVDSAVRGGYDPVGYARGRMAGDAAALTSGSLPT